MDGAVREYLEQKGYSINTEAYNVIKDCDEWYRNEPIADFHERLNVQGYAYELARTSFAKRACADEANLCEVVEITSGEKDSAQDIFVYNILRENQFETQYRKQLELNAAEGTVACYVRQVNADQLSDGTIKNGDIRLNYVTAENFIPLTVENDVIIEAGFVGETYKGTKRTSTLVLFTLDANGNYVSETTVFDSKGRIGDPMVVTLGNVKPFAVLRNAEVNNIKEMYGFGYPKIYNAIPTLKALDLCFNILFNDMDKGEKLVLINEMLCGFDSDGTPIPPNATAKKLFVLLGEKLPAQDSVYNEYNPEIRIDAVQKSFELLLSLLSMLFGYGTKQYTFQQGQIQTATQYIGEKQDKMQELNKQRGAAEQYIAEIVRAILWFANKFTGSTFDLEAETTVQFDDSFIDDRASRLAEMRNDALSFDSKDIKVLYFKEKYKLDDATAEKWASNGQELLQ